MDGQNSQRNLILKRNVELKELKKSQPKGNRGLPNLRLVSVPCHTLLILSVRNLFICVWIFSDRPCSLRLRYLPTYFRLFQESAWGAVPLFHLTAMLLHPFWSGRELRLRTQSSEETPEVAWENAVVSEQLVRAGRAARWGGMWLSEAVGRRVHTLTSKALGSRILCSWLWFGVKGSAPGCWPPRPSRVAGAVACVRPFLISVLTWCVIFWRRWFYEDALGWWVKCWYIFPQAPWSIIFLYFLGEKEESGNCVGGCCFDWCTHALKMTNLGVLAGIFCLFFLTLWALLDFFACR